MNLFRRVISSNFAKLYGGVRKNYAIKRCLHTSSYMLFEFHEKDPEYKDDLSKIQHIRRGMFMLKDEIKLWKEEIQEDLKNDPSFVLPGSIDKVFSFENKDSVNKWITTSDKDHNDGYSTCEFMVDENGKGIFEGFLTQRVPQDGLQTKAGYCNLKCKRKRKSFQREDIYEWGMYTHLVLRVRGDGRSYMINLHTPGYYDIFWNDIYQYVLFTRGGPYWQISKVPFSKFFLSSKGRVQDLQDAAPLDSISNISFTIADKIEGPFKLEIDYIGVENDPNHSEEFAYEMYQLPKGLSNS